MLKLIIIGVLCLVAGVFIGGGYILHRFGKGVGKAFGYK